MSLDCWSVSHAINRQTLHLSFPTMEKSTPFIPFPRFSHSLEVIQLSTSFFRYWPFLFFVWDTKASSPTLLSLSLLFSLGLFQLCIYDFFYSGDGSSSNSGSSICLCQKWGGWKIMVTVVIAFWASLNSFNSALTPLSLLSLSPLLLSKLSFSPTHSLSSLSLTPSLFLFVFVNVSQGRDLPTLAGGKRTSSESASSSSATAAAAAGGGWRRRRRRRRGRLCRPFWKEALM